MVRDMGFNDINLQVSGPQQPASTYKTKVLKGQVPFASQVTEPNTKYVIKHNFVLNGDVTIPANCILEFDGGSISGEHTITGQNTGIEAGLVKIFGTDVTLDGYFNIPILYPIWFGVDETETSFLTWYALRDAIPVLKPKEVRFDGEYHPNGVGFTNISDCILNFSESKVYGQTNNVDGSGTVIGFINCSNVTIKGGTFIARYFGGVHNGSVWNNCISISGKNVIVDGVTCYQENQDIGGRGIDLQGELLEDITIVNCTCYNGENGIDILPIAGYVAKNIIISNCNLIRNYQGILINVGGYGKYAQNIVISDINIESPIFRGLDIRGVHQLSVSNINIKGCKSTGIYTNLVDGTIKGVNVIADTSVSMLHSFEPTGIYVNETVPSMFDDYDGLKPLLLIEFYISGAFKNAINLIRGGMIIANGYAEGWDSSNYGIADSVNGNMYQNIAYKSEHELITVRLDTLYSNIYKQVSDNKVFPQRNNPVIPYGGFIDYPTYLTNPDQTAPNYRLIHESGYFKLKNTKTNSDLVKVEKSGKVWIGNMSLEGNNIQLIGLDGSTRYRIYVDNNGELQCVTA